jgi:hypothetical protein
MIHSFLLIGQSNMAGRGLLRDTTPITNKQLFAMRNGIFRQMYVPVNPDRSFSGVCLAESFADLYQKDTAIDTGLIPCADGGTSLDQWKEGSLLFDNACYAAELASRSSEIKGILWHQGESDCSPERYPVYAEKLSAMIDALRARLGMGDLPFIMGGLGDFLAKFPSDENLKNYPHINEALQAVAKSKNNCAFVSAEGLDSNPDFLHFNAPSLREFGARYYEEYKRIAPSYIPQSKSSPTISSQEKATAMELL